jgi:uncharacterized protein (DUF983 family)
MKNFAYIGYTVMANKLHLNTQGMDSTGKPNCGQGRIITIEFDGSDVISMRTAAEKATKDAVASGLELCGRCFKGRL